jgi:hypothetical protein
MTTSNNDVEIFSVGKWNGMVFVKEDLEQMAANFHLLRDRHKPPLKLGHTEKQILDQKDGQPALGWVDDLKVVGNKLVARFQEVSKPIAEAINAGRYKRVSSEIYFNVTDKGKNLGKVLKAVALLGADLPAVTDLADLPKLLSKEDDDNLIVFSDARVVEFSVNEGTIQTKEEKVTKENVADPHLETQLLELKKKNAELMKFKLESDDKAREFEIREKEKVIRRSAQKFTNDQSAFLGKVDEQIKAGVLEPKYKEKFSEALETQSANYTMESELTLPANLVLETVKQFSEKLKTGEQGFAQGKTEDDSTDPSEQLSNEVHKYMAEHPDVKDWEIATENVLKINPKLAKAYHQFTIDAEGRA